MNVLLKRREVLKKIILNCEKRLLKAPLGSLEIKRDRGVQRFFMYDGCASHYISKKNNQLAVDLAQKKYDSITLKLAKTELKKVNDLIETMESYDKKFAVIPTQLYDSIKINALSDSEYASKWQKTEYTGKSIFEETNYFTHRKEHVRSKSECIIADTLNKYNIPYHYEKPISIDGKIIQYPDYSVLNVRTRQEYLWEHLGMMDDSGYCSDAINKINRYCKFGYYPGKNLILTFESATCPLDTEILVKIINEYLK